MPLVSRDARTTLIDQAAFRQVNAQLVDASVSLATGWALCGKFATRSSKIFGMSTAEASFTPGHGPAAKVSVSLRAGNIRAIRDRVGSRGFSAYVDAAVERQIERDLLEEALTANEAESGPIPRSFKDEAAAVFREVKSSPELLEEGEWHARKAG